MSLLIVLLVFVGISLGLVRFLVRSDHGLKEPATALWLAAGFGLLGAGTASLIESNLLPDSTLILSYTPKQLLVIALAIGLIEEACKFLPLALFIYKKPYFNEHTDGVIYFALAGLAFGLPENILYTLQFGAATGLARLFLTPIFHAATTATIGYFLIKHKLSGKGLWKVGLVLITIMVLHALYDFGLLSNVVAYNYLALLLTLGVSLGMFLLYLKATEYDQRQGLSRVGRNNFCRTCGKPNPQHNLYCAYCGRIA